MVFLLAATFVLTILATTRTWNPWPKVWADTQGQVQAWWGHLTALSDPEPVWTATLDDQPDNVTVSNGRVLVGTRGKLTAFSTTDGQEVWDEEVQWALPAGDVVVVRLRPNNPDAVPTPNVGFSVLGRPRRSTGVAGCGGPGGVDVLQRDRRPDLSRGRSVPPALA